MITGLLEVRHLFPSSHCCPALAEMPNSTARCRQFIQIIYTSGLLVLLQNSSRMNQILMKKMLLFIFHTLRSTV